MIHQNQFHVSLKQIWKTNKGRSENSQISFWQHQEAISPVKTIQKKNNKKKFFFKSADKGDSSLSSVTGGVLACPRMSSAPSNS